MAANDEILAELLDRPKRTRTITLAWDPEDAEKLAAAQNRVRTLEGRRDRPNASSSIGDDLLEAEAELEALEADLATVVFEFGAIGSKRVDALMEKYPPSKEQQSKHRAAQGSNAQPLQYDPERYPKALIATACDSITTPDGRVMTEVDEDDITALFNTPAFSSADQVALFTAATLVDISSSSIDSVGKG